MDFGGRTVMVTGAAGNLGRAVVPALQARGAGVLALGRSRDSLEAAFGPAGARCGHVVADLLDRPRLEAAVAKAIARSGRVDALCHLAGAFRMGEAVHETSDETWDAMLDANARSFVNVARAVVPAMLAAGGGRIVAVGAAAAGPGSARMGAYCAAKSALARLVEAMSAELRGRGVGVNCVLPGTIDTPGNRAAMPDADPGRWVSPDDLARVVLFLASDESRAVHGAALAVTGSSRAAGV